MTTYRPGPPAASSWTSRRGARRADRGPPPHMTPARGSRPPRSPAIRTGRPMTAPADPAAPGPRHRSGPSPSSRPSARARGSPGGSPGRSANNHPRRTSGRRIRRRPAADAPPVSTLRRSTSRAAARWRRNPVAPTDRPTALRRTRRGHRGRSWAPKAMPPGRRSGAPSAPDRAGYRSCRRARPEVVGRATDGLAARCVALVGIGSPGGRRFCHSETSEHQARGHGHREGPFTAGTGSWEQDHLSALLL